MLLTVYVCGLLLTTVAILVAAHRTYGTCVSRMVPIVLAGVLWPVVAVGVVELFAVAGFLKVLRINRVDSGQAPMEHHRVLITY